LISVTKISVRSFDLDHLDVAWETSAVSMGQGADLTQHDVYDYQFYILRSEAAMGPYDTVGGPFRDPIYSFRDNRVSLLSKWRSFYYKIRVVHVPTGETAEFGPASNTQPEPDRIARAVRQEEDLLLREFIGRRCWVFPRRSFGPRCSCWDPIGRRRKVSNHLPCFNTGWLGGFLSPVECFVQIDPSPRTESLRDVQNVQQSMTTGRMTAFPPVNPNDILVESENRRWRIEAVAPTERLRATLRQELTLVEISKGDVEFQLPINIDLTTMQPAASRNFTNRQSLNESDADVSDILAFYGVPRGSIR
jgi:hypothetical protein